jgi:hypothetical protein
LKEEDKFKNIMLGTLIDILLILTLVYLSFHLFVTSIKKKKGGLLLRVVSIFILVHLVIFPLIYTKIINVNPESIEIDNKIVNREKDLQLKEFQKTNDTDYLFYTQPYCFNFFTIIYHYSSTKLYY